MHALLVCVCVCVYVGACDREGKRVRKRDQSKITRSPLLVSTVQIMPLWFFITIISFIGVVNTMVCSSGTLMQKK